MVSEGEPLDGQSQTLETQETVALGVTRDTTEAEKKQVKHRRYKRKPTNGKPLKITQATKEDSSGIEYEARLAEVKGKLPPELQGVADADIAITGPRTVRSGDSNPRRGKTATTHQRGRDSFPSYPWRRNKTLVDEYATYQHHNDP